MPRLMPAGRCVFAVMLGLIAVLAAGCAAAAPRNARPAERADFFPLTPASRWEYRVHRRNEGPPLRLVATVQPEEFPGPHGHGCRVVDERYGDRPPDERSPIVYCAAGGFLHRVMSLEYRGASLEDNGMRSGEIRFLPIDLMGTPRWEGRTSAYQLADGSGFEVRQLHTVFEQREPVDVPAGRFERCARVETTAIHSATGPDGSAVGPRIVYYYSDWYAPGVGLIRTEQRNVTAEVLATIELLGYEIGRKAAAQ